MTISQRELDLLCQAEEYADLHRKDIKQRMSPTLDASGKIIKAGEDVEAGAITAKVSAQVKRTPDYQGFILSQFGPEKIYELKQNARPVSYMKLDISQQKGK